MSRYVGAGKKLMSFLVPKPNVPKTEIGKKIRDLKISTQKSKAGTAKLNQTIFELKNNKPFTFKKNTKKSESNTESYKRITGENNKVIKGMLDKATEKKAMGGRIGLKHGSYENVPPSKGFSEYVTKEKQKKINEANKKANEKDKPGRAGPMGRAPSLAKKDSSSSVKPIIIDLSKGKDGKSIFKVVESKADGGRIGRKFGSPNPRKTNVQKIKETFGSKKNVPSKLKGFSKLPEAIQQKMNKKLARKV